MTERANEWYAHELMDTKIEFLHLTRIAIQPGLVDRSVRCPTHPACCCTALLLCCRITAFAMVRGSKETDSILRYKMSNPGTNSAMDPGSVMTLLLRRMHLHQSTVEGLEAADADQQEYDDDTCPIAGIRRCRMTDVFENTCGLADILFVAGEKNSKAREDGLDVRGDQIEEWITGADGDKMMEMKASQANGLSAGLVLLDENDDGTLAELQSTASQQFAQPQSPATVRSTSSQQSTTSQSHKLDQALKGY